MSKYLILTILSFLILSCHGRQISTKQTNDPVSDDSSDTKDTWINYNKDSAIVDSIYGKNSWAKLFRQTKTSMGVIIKFKIINSSRYILQWGDLNKIKSFPDTLYLDGRETGIPRLVSENDKYIVLRSGCGNPCWIGYFLPKDTMVLPLSVNEYLGYNIDEDLVAYVKDTNVLETINIKTRKTQDIILKGCNSAFLGYCIDSLEIKNKILKYRFTPDTYIESKKSHIKREKIKI